MRLEGLETSDCVPLKKGDYVPLKEDDDLMMDDEMMTRLGKTGIGMIGKEMREIGTICFL